jgi:molecular chaperone GrpE
MEFGDHFDKFISDRNKTSNNIEISKEELQDLKERAEKYEFAVSQVKTLRLENKELKEILKDLKVDDKAYKELKEENEKYLKSLLRVQADFDNYKKRIDRENQNYKLYAMNQILLKLINHYNDLKRFLRVLEAKGIDESIRKGIEMIVQNYKKILEEEGVKPMNSEGQIFDPYKHEVLNCIESNLPENTIIEELDQGFFFNNKVLRPAKVIISKNSNSCKKTQ